MRLAGCAGILFLAAGCATSPAPVVVPRPPVAAESVPTPGAHTYVVQKGDTFWSISKKTGTTVDILRRINPGVDTLEIGQVLALPGTQSRPAPSPSVGSSSSPVAESIFVKPVRNGGRVVQNNSQSVSIRAPYGDEVLAAKSGKVSFVGAVPGYGNTVMIKHSDGYVSIYGHTSAVEVQQGQNVRQGEVIAKVGNVGGSGPSQVVFLLFKNDTFVNPSGYIR